MTTTAPTDAAHAITERLRLRKQLPAPAMRRAIREAAGLSAAELAALMGLSRQAVSQYETGRRTPRGAELETYVAALNAMSERSGSPDQGSAA